MAYVAGVNYFTSNIFLNGSNLIARFLWSKESKISFSYK